MKVTFTIPETLFFIIGITFLIGIVGTGMYMDFMK